MSEPVLTNEEVRQMVSKIDPDAILAGLKKLLDDPEIAKFLDELIHRAAAIALKKNNKNTLVEGGDVLKIFARVREQRGIRRGDGNAAIGFIGIDTAEITIGTARPGPGHTKTSLTQYLLKKDVAYALHETLHHAGMFGYLDEDYARAVCEMLNTTIEEAVEEKRRDKHGYGTYWNGELKRRCRLD